jgi:hypothetical protein
MTINSEIEMIDLSQIKLKDKEENNKKNIDDINDEEDYYFINSLKNEMVIVTKILHKKNE